jgi:hypothetical protein
MDIVAFLLRARLTLGLLLASLLLVGVSVAAFVSGRNDEGAPALAFGVVLLAGGLLSLRRTLSLYGRAARTAR